jgi:hypothetical protein
MKNFTGYFLSFLIVILSINAISQDIIEDDYLSGTLGPGFFITYHDLFVDYNDSLTIADSTIIQFTSGTSMIVYGCLISNGTQNDSIVFTSSGENVTWKGISFPVNKSSAVPGSQLWTSKFSYCHFENVNSEGAIFFTCDDPNRKLDNISHCSFVNVNKAISILYARQSNITVNHSAFSGVNNLAITVGNTYVSNIQLLDNTIDNQSNRFLYVYSNGLLNNLEISSNSFENLVMGRSLILIEDNQNLSSLHFGSNEFLNFSASSFLETESIIDCIGLDNLNSLVIENNDVDEIFDQEMNSIHGFFHLEYAKDISIFEDTVSTVYNLKHFFVIDDCESFALDDSKYGSINCSTALFKITADNSCLVQSSYFNDISTGSSGKGCFFLTNFQAMDDILFNANTFRIITAQNGPCFNINSASGVIETFSFSENAVIQNEEIEPINGGVGYLLLESVNTFKSNGNDIRNSNVSVNGGVYYLDVNTINDIESTYDTLNNIKATNKGGYISVNGTIYNENLIIDHLTADTSMVKIGSGGILYIESENSNTGKVQITNCSLNYFHARKEEDQFYNDGGGFFIKGNYRKLVFSDNHFLSQQSVENYPIAKNGGILYFEHSGTHLDSVMISRNVLNRQNPFDVTGSGGSIYFTSTGDLGYFSLNDNTFNGFHSNVNGGICYLDLNGKSDFVLVKRNSFSAAVADTSGGAVFFRSHGIGMLDISGSQDDMQSFSDCQAVNGSGGGLFIQTLQQPVSDMNITFNNIQTGTGEVSSMTEGGCFYVQSGGTDINEVDISDNVVGNANGIVTSGGNGGAFYLDIQGACNLLQISNNDIKSCVSNGSGGAIYFKSTGIGNLDIHGTENTRQKFTNCRSENGSGGAIYIYSMANNINDLNITYNEFQATTGLVSANTNGGMIFVKSDGGNVNQINFAWNSAGSSENNIIANGNGGAFYFEFAGSCAILDFSENNMINCRAGQSGGGLYFKSNGIGLLNIIGSVNKDNKYENCWALAGDGGAIYINSLPEGIGAINILSNSIYSLMDDDNAESNGGGIFVKSAGDADVGFINILNNSFGNASGGIRANGDGGALYCELMGKCSWLRILDNSFENCLAHGSGGAINFKSNGLDLLSIAGSSDTPQIFDNCIAETNSGGAIYINSPDKAVGRMDIQFNDIRSVTGVNSANENGGAIAVYSGNGNVEAVNLHSNRAGDGNAKFAAGINGGAFYFNLQGSCDSLNVIENNFDKCYAGESGGAVFFTSAGLGQLFIQGSEIAPQAFNSCQAENGSGGSVFISTLSQPISNIIVSYNEIQSAQQMVNAGNHGGAMFFHSQGGNISHIMMNDNTLGNEAIGIKCGANGGGFYFDVNGNCNQADVLYNEFHKCSADGSGGAIYLKSSGIGQLKIAGSETTKQLFSNCFASGDGGSFYFSAGSITKTDLTNNLINNSHAQNGGAFSLAYNNIITLELYKTDFENCYAIDNGGSLNLAGKDNAVPETGDFTIINCSFIKSVSNTGNGGGIYYKGSILEFSCTDSKFTENKCNGIEEGFGAAVYFNLLSANLSNVNFSGITVEDCFSTSGGLYLENVDFTTFSGSTFKDNSCGHNGAALTITDFDTVMINQSMFNTNRSGDKGGALYVDSGSGDHSLFRIESSNLEFNESNRGGAMALGHYYQAAVSGNTFIQNICTDNAVNEPWGGAIYSLQNDRLSISDNIFIRNELINDPEKGSFGGSVAVSDDQLFNVSNNKFYYSNAINGGAIYAENSNSNLTSEFMAQGNLFFSNTGKNGGAIYANLKSQDNMTTFMNLFVKNVAKYSGGAVYVKNLDKYTSNRNIFKSNVNQGENLDESTGGSALFSLEVSEALMFNNVFDENKYEYKIEDLDKQPTAWFRNTDSIYFENCTFLYHTPNDRPLIHTEGASAPVYIINSIFTRNLDPETPITNGNAHIQYSLIEGDPASNIDAIHCYEDLEPQFMTDSYILDDNALDFIDAGNPAEKYNDSIHYPVGKGTDLCDLGVSGGRYNVWAEDELHVPSYNDYARRIKVDRYNDKCHWYKIYFALGDGDNFGDFEWYVDDSIFNTGSVNEKIKYISEDKFVSITGIARNLNDGTVIIGNDTINSSHEVLYSSTRIEYAGDKYDCDAVITLNDTCPAAINSIRFSFLDMQVPFFDTFEYTWSITDLVGIESYSITDSSYNNVLFDLVPTNDTSSNRSLTIAYNGSDNICNIEFNHSCTVHFNYADLNDVLQVVRVYPEENDELNPQNVFLEIEMNAPLYYCNGENFFKIEEGAIDPSLNMISFDPEVGITKLEYAENLITIYPNHTAFSKGNYILNVNHVCNSCGFPYNYSEIVNIKYVGIDSNQLKYVKIWPNPASDKVFVQVPESMQKIQLELINALGHIVRTGMVANGNIYAMNVSSVPSGMYYLKMYNDNSQECFYQKLIVE